MAVHQCVYTQSHDLGDGVEFTFPRSVLANFNVRALIGVDHFATCRELID